MIPIRTSREIEIMKEGGQRLSWVFSQVLAKISPGIKLKKLDCLAEKLIQKQGGFPSFKMVPGYDWATCINVNQGVVHGIPGDYQIIKGDVASLDMGMFFQGLHTDMARTVCVQTKNVLNTSGVAGCATPPRVNKFLGAGKKALKKAIEAARPGNRVGHISLAMEKEVRKAGFNPVETLTGHGVGEKLHEEPQIPCFLKTELKKTPLIKPGMSLAVEVIYTQGSPRLILGEDNWTIETADRSLAGLFEDTVIVTKKKPLVLTFLD